MILEFIFGIVIGTSIGIVVGILILMLKELKHGNRNVLTEFGSEKVNENNKKAKSETWGFNAMQNV